MSIEALNNQFNKERENHATYRAMADALDASNWPGSSAWMRHASDDEQTHAEKLASYIVDRNAQPIYADLAAPAIPKGDDLLACFTSALSLEQANTRSIIDLYNQAVMEGDIQTSNWLIWAIDEQTRSEREITDILLQLRRADGNAALLLIDTQLGESVA
jgi:ferritin